MKNLEKILNLVGRVEGKSLTKEIEEARKSYTKHELKEMIIVEKQHVAGFKYDNVIDLIVGYIDGYIQINPPIYDRWEFTIPTFITKQFDFVHDMTIEVQIINYTLDATNANYHGEGETLFHRNNHIFLNKISDSHIIVGGIAFDNTLVEYSVRNNLYHELNHAYEEYKRTLNNDKKGMFNHILSYNNMQNKIAQSGDDDYTKIFQFIHYRLFNNSELSAAASSTYAFLKSIKGKRENLARDLKQTQGFIEYSEIKKYVETLEQFWNEEWWENKRNLYDKKLNITPQAFKNWFIGCCRILLNKYFHYMTSAAALYYNETEEKKTIPTIISTGKKPQINNKKF